MYKISYNVTFVYCLLVVDLLINMTDHLIPPTQPNLIHGGRDIDSLVFSIVIIQVFAILSVVVDLVLHFFQASDQIIQLARLESCNSSGKPINSPMPQRIGLKLVLDKYWWSLFVGLMYLVLTIILQIIRLDPSWHNGGRTYSSMRLVNLTTDYIDSKKSDSLKMDNNEMIVSSAEADAFEDDKLSKSTGISSSNEGNMSDIQSTYNFLPVLILLVHKLMSTCYYVSFVVVYRVSSNSMVNRMFAANKSQQSN